MLFLKSSKSDIAEIKVYKTSNKIDWVKTRLNACLV